ncbi:MAG: hypothetical protein CME25_01915 [Gemmatimonadetes bacterium]|nr:hypothetical protein [Gemmatimonadota bacterium]
MSKEQLSELRCEERTLWAPGPHALTPSVQQVLNTYTATYTHRSSDYKACYASAAMLLKELFSIPGGFIPLIFGHTGSYNWEMVVRNTPETYLTLGMDLGAFSSKWVQVFKDSGRAIDVLPAPAGQGISTESWREGISKSYDLALVTHNETSSGVALPLGEFCRIAKEISPETLLAVDGVSIAGAVEVDYTMIQPDYYLFSLQKDFSIPAIGSVMIVSERALDAAGRTRNRGYVLDLLEWTEKARLDQTPMTVPDLTLRCLIARLEEMLAEGIDRVARHGQLAQMQRDWAAANGLKILAEPGYESPTVTAIHLPEGISGPDFVKAASTYLNIQLAPGYGTMRDTSFRIASMGHTTVEMMTRALKGLQLILQNWEELSRELS